MKKAHKRAAHLPGLFFRQAAAKPTELEQEEDKEDGLSRMELGVPKFAWGVPTKWEDVGSTTWLVSGTNLEDKRSVIAKVAPASTAAGMVLEREVHILGKLSGSLATSEKALRLVDFYIIPPAAGNVVVLILQNPGANVLPSFYPNRYSSTFLCALSPNANEDGQSQSGDSVGHLAPRERSETSIGVGTSDGGLGGFGETTPVIGSPMLEGGPEEAELRDLTEIDLASFLDFAIQATQCVDALHSQGIVHREIRPNAWHWNVSAGVIRFAHMGNRSVSLDALSSEYWKEQNVAVREVLAYLAPEQTDLVDRPVDQRTDLYSLGATLFALLTGQVPFGYSNEILQAIVSRRPRLVHDLRPDIPVVLSNIIDKLLSKNPSDRYLTASGLVHDLQLCQLRLLDGRGQQEVSSSSDLLPEFLLGTMDRFSSFIFPSTVYGRQKELDAIRSVLQRVSTTQLQQYQPRLTTAAHSTGSFSSTTDTTPALVPMSSSFGQQTQVFDQVSEAGSSSHASNAGSLSNDALPALLEESRTASSSRSFRTGSFASSTGNPTRGFTRKSGRERGAATRTVVVSGSTGMGKSALVGECQSDFRKAGWFGSARFEAAPSAPYSTILQALSSIFRQLLDSRAELNQFWQASRDRLGPCMHNVQLLHSAIPELKEISELFGYRSCTTEVEVLQTDQARARFLALVLDVITVLTQLKMVTIVLDDLHFADEPSLSLLRSLAAAKVKMLLVVTVKPDFLPTAHEIFGQGSRATYIPVSALSLDAVTSLVSEVLHDSAAHVAPLAQTLYHHSHGNVFLVRELLLSMKRSNHVWFDYPLNFWRFNMNSIESQFFPEITRKDHDEVCDVEFLKAHLNELPKEVQRFLGIASHFASNFRQQDVCSLMDEEQSSSDGSSSDETIDPVKLSRVSMAASQTAIAEGWITARGRGFYAFAHERYRQAAQSLDSCTSEEDREQMSLKIADILLNYPATCNFEAAGLLLKCIPLLLRTPPVDPTYRECLLIAGNEALAQGAHETALNFLVASEKLSAASGAWQTERTEMFELSLTLVGLELYTKNWIESRARIEALYAVADTPCLKARVMFKDARQKWVENDPQGHFELLLSALDVVGFGVTVQASPDAQDLAYAAVKSLVTAKGAALLDLPSATGRDVLLASELLAEATVAAFWARKGGIGVIAFKLVELVLTRGMTPSAGLGFIWLGIQASHMYGDLAFGAQMSHLAIQVSQHPTATNGAKGRTIAIFGCMAPYASSIKESSENFIAATRFALAAGDLTFACFGRLHELASMIYASSDLSDVIVLADEVVSDLQRWQPDTHVNAMGIATANCAKALAGRTINVTPATVMDTDTWTEERGLLLPSEDTKVARSWYFAFKIVALYSLGWTEEAAALGFSLWEDKDWGYNHHHPRRAAFYHSLALLDQLQTRDLPIQTRDRYLAQIALNQGFNSSWADFAPGTYQHWVLLVQAELDSLQGLVSAFSLYDRASKMAEEGGWTSDLGWCQALAGKHYARIGAIHLGTELQSRSVSTHTHMGATAVADYLSLQFEHVASPREAMVDCAVQTDNHHRQEALHADGDIDDEEDMAYKDLSLRDVQAIIQGSLTLGSNINVTATLESLTELFVKHSKADHGTICLRREDGQYTMVSTCTGSEAAVVFEDNAPLLVDAEDAGLPIIASHVIGSDQKLIIDDTSQDPRFAEISGEQRRSIVCLPLHHRGRTMGCVYLSSSRLNRFTQTVLDVLTILSTQACIAIGNAMLFKKLQRATQANLKMIVNQQKALDEARRSREDAVKASKIKSNFLASMSHELRTPFSSFFGLLGLLSETPLDQEQQDFVQTARSSCELLLDIIDSLLDYSKLEAGALKLSNSPVSTEDAAADCLELLIPMAISKGLNLSYKIDPDVPLAVVSDSSRVRQVLMNLLGNSLKFTPSGSVTLTVSVSLPETLSLAEDEVGLHVEVIDTGIGMSDADQQQLFQPFSQVDGSTTRRFGGTGLGLSICKGLVCNLFKGKIGVRSEAGAGSTFWFDIPVTKSEVQDQKSGKHLRKLQSQVNTPVPLAILAFSPSPATLDLISSAFQGSSVTSVKTVDELIEQMKLSTRFTLFIIDCQTSRALEAVKRHANPLSPPNILRLLAPSIEALRSRSEVLEGVSILYHPVRRRKLLDMSLQLTTRLKRRGSAEERSMLPAVPMSPAPLKTIEHFTNDERETLATCHVLISEDNPVASKLLVKTLIKGAGVKVTATDNGTAAVNEWASQPEGHFSLALFDHHMPGSNNSGPDASGRIRTLESRKGHLGRLPIVGLSADVQPTARALGISAGMDDYLSKPLRQQDLISLVKKFILPPDPARPPSLISSNSSASTASAKSSAAAEEPWLKGLPTTPADLHSLLPAPAPPPPTSPLATTTPALEVSGLVGPISPSEDKEPSPVDPPGGTSFDAAIR